MRTVKKFITLSVMLVLYVAMLTLLVQQVTMYRVAYQRLSAMISHASIDTERGVKD